MKAILITENNRLTWTKVKDLVCGTDEAKIKVAAALNPADLMQRVGDYPPLEPRGDGIGSF